VKKLAKKTVLGFTQLIVALGTLLFGTAWTFDYWQAWVYLFVFAASCALITAYLWSDGSISSSAVYLVVDIKCLRTRR
jgi:ABC-type multidrug transport system permease subunit